MPKPIDHILREEILELRDTGESYVAIESKLGVPLATVIQIVKDRHVSGEIRDNTPYADRPVLKPRHKISAARALRTAGWSLNRIAKHLDISHTSAHLFARDIQIPYKPPSAYDTAKVIQRKQLRSDARAMRWNGELVETIANQLGISVGHVYKMCKGIKPPKHQKHAERKRLACEMRDRGDTLKTIGAYLGVAPQTVSDWTRNHYRKKHRVIITDMHSQMLEMRRMGARLKTIAAKFGLSIPSVSRVLSDLLEASISGETLYYYRRDANGMVTEMERHKVAASGEVVIEKVRM